ncbi:MAG: LysM peptidoglycan-binding domain-containing protein [Caldilineaceae bacterium]
MLLSAVLVGGCTRERVPESTPATDGSVPTVDTSVVDEPEVVVLPAAEATDTSTPEPTATPEIEVDTMPYTVQPGDTVSTIAEQFGITSQELRQMNLLNDDQLRVGQVLRVPNTGAVDGDGNAGPAPVATTGPFIYVVQPGDSLMSIALKFDVSTNEIVAANTLEDPDSVFVGQELIIPGRQVEVPATPVPPQPFEYVIQAGDTLFSIAQKFDVAAQEIIDANAIPDPDNLIQGRVLVIPGYQGAIDARTGEDNTANEVTNDVGAAVHTVRAGETLLEIARLYDVAMVDIASANGLANPDQIRPGQQLTIPGVTAAQVRAANQTVHTVARGETLFSIAQRYGVTTDSILEANNMTNPNFITVGQELIIPSEE